METPGSQPPGASASVAVDVVIFGGGAAGLWILDELHRAGYAAVLLEAHELGRGQTISSQGIIHGGLKYTLTGLLSPAAQTIRDMPLIWRRCLSGEQEPDLSRVTRRADYCHLWRTAALSSRLGLIGAKAGLRVAPRTIGDNERPEVLAHCPGRVNRLEEQVIEPVSFISVLADAHQPRLLKVDIQHGVEFRTDHDRVERILLINSESGDGFDLQPRTVVLCAGAGNQQLRKMIGLPATLMQRRPLHMVLVRGENLPVINGHCVDGRATRVTITTARDFADRPVWQVGGNVAERGVSMEPDDLIEFARAELRDVLPGVSFTGTEWATYRVDRAEAGSGIAGQRPDDIFASRSGNVITCWPTKLALVPRLAANILGRLDPPRTGVAAAQALDAMRRFPRPRVAWPPWEHVSQWRHES